MLCEYSLPRPVPTAEVSLPRWGSQQVQRSASRLGVRTDVCFHTWLLLSSTDTIFYECFENYADVENCLKDYFR